MEFQSAQPHSNESPLIARTVRLRRLKAFAVVFAASLLLLSVLFSWSPAGFIARSHVRLGLAKEVSPDAVPQTMDRISELVRQRWEQLTKRQSLNSMMDELGIKNRPGQDIAMSIGNALEYSFESTADNNQMLHIFLEGRVSPDERKLVDRLTRYLAGDIALAPVISALNQRQPVLSEPKAEFVGQQLAICDRIQWIAEQLNQDVDYLKEQIPQEESLASDRGVESPQQSILQQKLDSLQVNRLEMANRLGVSDEELARLDREISAVQTRLAQSESALQPDKANWFKNASYSKPAGGELIIEPALGNALHSIDTDSLMVAVQELKQNLSRYRAVENVAMGENDVAAGMIPVFVKGVKRTEVAPINGGMTNGWFFALVLMSSVIATVVSYRYQPLVDDRGFRNVEQVTAMLRLPVYGQVEKFADEPEADFHLPISNMLVNGLSYVLIGCSVLVLAALTFSPTMREAFSDHPFQAFLQLLWIYPA